MTQYPVTNLVVFDLEVNPNFFLAGFELPSGEVMQYWVTDQDLGHVQALKDAISWFQWNGYTLCGFNSQGYDDPVLSEFLINPCTQTAYATSLRIIEDRTPRWNFNDTIYSVDLMPVLPGRMSLKKIGVCLAHKKLQELPVNPHKNLTPEEMRVVMEYNKNDLAITRKLINELQGELDLRSHMSDKYHTDLRSKGEAGIAETVLTSEYYQRTGVNAKSLKTMARDRVRMNPTVQVKPPTWWSQLPVERYRKIATVVEVGEVIFQRVIQLIDYRMEAGALSDSLFLGDRWYSMGVGGLHSVDGPGAWEPANNEIILDVDVTSYYPSIILTQGLHPEHWGEEFLDIYGNIVADRVTAKRTREKKTAEGLKVLVNSAFGKLLDPYSALFDPQAGAQITVSGQLALLVLIAMIEERCATVISANTDGLTVLLKTCDYGPFKRIVEEWENLTGFEMEYTEYSRLLQRDVNNYVAVKRDGGLKTKGVFNIPKRGEFDLRHSPNAQICARAVNEYLEQGTPLIDTIIDCMDLQEFILTQQVKGNWATSWNGEPQGKMLRFYKSNSAHAAPIIRTPKDQFVKGNEGQVTNSAGCVPVADFPEAFPLDIDYLWYVETANEMLLDISHRKQTGRNKAARLLQENGLWPVVVDTRVKTLRRNRPQVGSEDFDALKPHEALGICTGKGTCVMVLRSCPGESVEEDPSGVCPSIPVVIWTSRGFPSKTRPTIAKQHGVEIIYGGNIGAGRVTELMPTEAQMDQLEAFYYTQSELNKVRGVTQ